ncbi:MAG: nucleotidyltransferase domain-containing protein [Proteobacteria bacterium]|nr:nucleotidyltransferase domain-containing protein [Pseudomonadota bacterium]
MFIHEREALKDVIQALRGRLRGKIVSAHAFGSRVRGSQDEWSDFDLLVIVDGRTPALEKEVIGIIVEEETKKGISFAPVVKDIREFELEKRFNTPFYENIVKEGVPL